jgi:uncharacterized MAPEG superfamily protein
MTTELTLLALSAALGFVHILASSHSGALQRGYWWSAGPRDDAKPLTGLSGRLERALRNYLETFPLFAAAILIAHAADRHDWLTLWGAQFYFWGRVFYLPLYVLGVPLIRSLAWNVASAGIILVLVALI